MTEQEDRHTLSIQIANQIINMANHRLEEGIDPADVAAGLRHAAANFTAFAVSQTERPADIPVDAFNEEFAQIYGYYLERHMANRQPEGGLDALIRQVRDET